MTTESCLNILWGDRPYTWLDACTVPPFPQWLSSMLFLWGVVFCLITTVLVLAATFIFRTARIDRRLKTITQQLSSLTGKRSWFVGSDLRKLRTIFAADSMMQSSWSEFEATLIIQPAKDEPTPVYSTRPVEEFFTQDRVAYSGINLSFYSSLPGLITSFGLLATFVAILIGLSQVHEDAATHQLMGVKELVYGLSGKFISSIVALLLAILFTSLEKFAIHRMHHSYRLLVTALNTNFQRISSERLLLELLRSNRKHSKVLHQHNAKLPATLSRSIGEELRPLSAQIATALTQLGRQNSHGVETLVSSLIDEFRAALLGSSQTELNRLTLSLGEMATALREMTTADSALGQQMVAIVASFEGLLSRHTEASKDSLSRIVQQSKSVSEVANKRVESMLQLQSDQVRDLGVLRQALLDAAEQFSKAVGSASPGLAKIATLATGTQGIMESLKTSTEVLNRLQLTSSDVVTNGIKKMDELAPLLTRQEEVLRQFESVYSTLDQSIGRALNMVVTNLDSYTSKVHSSLQKGLSEFDNHLAIATNQLGTTVTSLSDTLEILVERRPSMENVPSLQMPAKTMPAPKIHSPTMPSSKVAVPKTPSENI